MSDDEVFEKTVTEDGKVEIPTPHAGRVASIIHPELKVVLRYAEVGRDGTVEVGPSHADTDVLVVSPEDQDESMRDLLP